MCPQSCPLEPACLPTLLTQSVPLGGTLWGHTSAQEGHNGGKTVGKIWAPVEHMGAHFGGTLWGTLWGRILMGIPVREHFVETRWGVTLGNTLAPMVHFGGTQWWPKCPLKVFL